MLLLKIVVQYFVFVVFLYGQINGENFRAVFVQLVGGPYSLWGSTLETVTIQAESPFDIGAQCGALQVKLYTSGVERDTTTTKYCELHLNWTFSELNI